MNATQIACAILEDDEIDDTKTEAIRLLLRQKEPDYSQLRKWRPYIHHSFDGSYYAVFIVPVFTRSGNLSKANSWRGWYQMRDFTYQNPPTWEQQVEAVRRVVIYGLPGFSPHKLEARGFQVGTPYEPYEGKFYTPDGHEPD